MFESMNTKKYESKYELVKNQLVMFLYTYRYSSKLCSLLHASHNDWPTVLGDIYV